MTLIDVSRKEALTIDKAINDINTSFNMIELMLQQYNKPWWAVNDEKSKYHAKEIERIRENNDDIVEYIRGLVLISKGHVDRSASIFCKIIVHKINEVEMPGCYDEDEDEVSQ